MDKLYALLGKLPTTNARIAVTLLLYIATGVVTLVTGKFPGAETWAAVLIVMSGLDATQFYGKRRTWSPQSPQNGKVD